MSNRSHSTVAGRAHLGVVLATAAALPLSAVSSQPSATAAEAGSFVAVPVDQAAIQMEAALRGSSALGGTASDTPTVEGTRRQTYTWTPTSGSGPWTTSM